LGSVLLLVALTVLAIKGAKKRPYAVVGWLWYVGTLVPVIGIVQVGNQAMADRYTYIPLIGLFIIVAWAAPDILKKWPHRKGALIALSALCLLCLFLVTWRQVGYWRNSIALYDHALEVADPSSLIYYNRGTAYNDLGNYPQAIADFNRAIEINPRSGDGYNNRGVAYGSLGKPAQAIADFTRAVEIDPRFEKAYNNRGLAYANLADYPLAIADFTRAVGIDPQYADAYYNRGAAYGRLGNRERAIDDIRTAARLGHEGAKGFLRSQNIVR
jgi:tetratricopeptide (TPR) repeat protein